MRKLINSALVAVLLLATLTSGLLASPTPLAQAAPLAQEPTPATVVITNLEPDSVLGAAGGQVSVYGSGFEPGMAVRLVGWGLVSTTVVNSSAMVIGIPPGVPKSRYAIELIMADGSTIRSDVTLYVVGEKKQKATATPKPSTNSTSYNQPQLVIDSSVTTPETLSPGEPFTLKLHVTNRGDYTASNVRISLASPELAVPREGSNLIVVDKLAKAEGIDINLPLALSEEVTQGYHNLLLTIEYSDGYGRSFTSNQSVGLNASQAATDRPMLLVNSYTTEPASLSPGDAFTLHLELTNVGDSPASQILATFGGDPATTPTTTGTQAFAILDGGNVKFFPTLEPGATITIDQRFALDGSAASGVYKMPVTLNYVGANQEARTETQAINLLVNRRPQLQISFYRSLEESLPDQPVTLPIEVVNLSRSMVNISTLEVIVEHAQVPNGSMFVGALDGGTSSTFDAEVIPLQSGTLKVEVRVHYLDDFNQPQLITQALELEVTSPQVTPEGEAPTGEEASEPGSAWEKFLRAIRGLFGLGS